MDPNFYVIDPEGDLLLVVEEHLGRLHVSVFPTIDNPSISIPRERPSGHTPWLPWEHPWGSAPISPNGRSERLIHALRFQPEVEEMQIDTSALLRIQLSEGVRVYKLKALISSKHLTLSSKFFRAKLDAMVSLTESDILPPCAGDVEALLVLLDALHCQTRKVPRFLSPDMLFMVAVLADHYGCVEAVEAFSEVWIENLTMDVPVGYTEDLVKWIFSAWIFRDQSLFELTTGVAVRESIGPMSCLGMPMIPENLLKAIEKARLESIEYLIQALYRRVENPAHRGCCDDCDQLIVGTLVRQLQLNRLYPRPTAPFHGYSVNQLVGFLNAVPEPACNAFVHLVNGCPSSCALLPEIDRGFFDIFEKVVGMVVEAFFPRPEALL